MSLPITTGVELELWVVDDEGRLCDGRELADAHDRIKPEFIEPLLEIQTDPHDAEAELRRDLQETLRAAIGAARARDMRLVPLGTPLTPSDGSTTTERGKLFEAIYGDGVRSAKNCAGTHVHFEKGNVRRQINVLTALDPALALVNSSPYYLGERLLDSSRAFAYRKECGPEFRRYCDLWGYTDSVDEWTSRVETVFEAFTSLAVERGVPASRVEEYFTPEDTVLNPVRLRECQPTVEWRAPDATLPSQIVQLAADVGRLVDGTETKRIEYGSPGVRDDHLRLPDSSALRDLSREAIRSGLDAAPVRNYLREMGFDLSAYRPLSPRLSGPATLTESEACTLRLEHARRFEADVQTLSLDSTRGTATARYA